MILPKGTKVMGLLTSDHGKNETKYFYESTKLFSMKVTFFFCLFLRLTLYTTFTLPYELGRYEY